MQKRFGLDCISYLTDVLVAPHQESEVPSGADRVSLESQRRALQDQIQLKQQEADRLLVSLRKLEQQMT